MLSKSNFYEWFNRYKYAEFSAICMTIASTQFYRFFDAITTAYLITICEYFAFYGVILFQNYKQLHKENQNTSWRDALLLAKHLLFEFGYPSVLDFLFVRPFCMYWLPLLCGNYFTGIVLGKIAADSVFYSCAIINYEWIKRKKTKHL